MEEIWKDIPGYEGYYQVSTLGRVRSVDRYINQLNRWGKVQTKLQQGRLLTPGESHDRYQSVSLCRNGITRYESVHRLVAIAFIPNPDDLPQVNHTDEDPSNNRVDNLEWCTSLYNNNYGTRKEKLSRSLSGKVRSEEYKQQMRQERAGRGNPMYGKQQSAEARAKISAALKGKPKSPECIEKARQKLVGRTPWNKGLHTRPIVCLDAGITFKCAEDAANWIGQVTPEAVEYVLKRTACCKGHVFVHADNIPENIQEYIDECRAHYRSGKKSGRPCRCIEDNISFKSISDAAKHYNISHNVLWSRIQSGRGTELSGNRIVHFEAIPYAD